MKIAIAPFELEEILAEELGTRLLERHGRLMIFDGDFTPTWAQNVWLEAEKFSFKSISEAANHLRSIQRNWWLHSANQHRRASLIQEKLPTLKPKPFEFLAPVPTAPLGAFTLLDANTMLYSPLCSSPFPDGEVSFLENKNEPPSRAYLKLWELFTLENFHPAPNEKVLDLGSSPGGWTWVLDQLGCEVISVDRSPLSSETKFSKRVQFIERNAFSLSPSDVGAIDWLFSDLICYPGKLLELIENWRTSAQVRNFVCTIKFQEPTDHAIVARFLSIAGSKLRHLRHNKHELTWWLRR